MLTPQSHIQSFLDDQIASGKETGLQVAAYHKGRLVVDAWAGVADSETGRKVDGDTLFVVFSVTKGITVTVIHMLAERGLVHRVVWPWAGGGIQQPRHVRPG
jgi:CubicO group peptidase (beta-lactamase class C family)